MPCITPKEIDQYLPQRNAGFADMAVACYAEALVFENAPIHLCSPGGVKTLIELGKLLQQDPTPQYLVEMEKEMEDLQAYAEANALDAPNVFKLALWMPFWAVQNKCIPSLHLSVQVVSFVYPFVPLIVSI